MNNNLTEVNKVLGENVTNIKRKSFTPWNGRVNMFNIYRKNFCDALERDGYSTFTQGNYITAKRGMEENTFFFCAHSPERKNYLVPCTLANRVQYFAFYDEAMHKVYKVAYNKVREYCKNITVAYTFANNNPKLFIPDSWAKQQVINSYDIQ